MARRRMYTPQPEYVPPGMVDFGQIDFGHDVVAQQMPGILQNYQQRWDMQDAAIAKLLEEQAGTQMLEGDAQAVGNLLKDSFDEIDTLVKDKYQGDRGAASMDIVKRLSAARAPLAQAKAEKERYDKAFEQYQQLAVQGKAPQTFITDDKGNIAPKTLGFEEFYSDAARPAFDEKGKYTPRTYGTLRGASDLTGYLDKGISKKLSSDLYQGSLKKYANDPEGFMSQITNKGYSSKQLENYFNSKDFNKAAFIQQLKGEVPHLAAEFEGVDDNELFDYAKNIIKTQVSEQLIRDYKQDPAAKSIGKPKKPIISGASVYADISANPFIEKRGTTYVKSLNDFEVSRFHGFLGAKRKYDNSEDLLNEYNERLVEVTKKVAINTENGNLKGELEEALLAGSNAMIGAMVGKIIASYGAAGMGGLAILPFTLKGDTRPLNEKDILAITSAYNGLQSVVEDIKNARENLSSQGVDISKMNDREIAEYLDKDYTLRSKTQDVLYLTTYQGAKALSNMYNENPQGKLSGGFRSAENTDMLPLDVLAKKFGADTDQLEKQVMDSKQWNYNLDTGEFGMKLNVAKKGKEPKNKTIYFTLDNATTEISNGLKEINVLESNPSKKRNLDEQIQEKGKGVTISTFPEVYDIQYVGGKNPYSVIYMDFETRKLDVVENLNATQLKLFIKNRIVNPYLQYTYGED